MDQILANEYGTILSGVGITLALTVFGFLGALLLGTVVAICRVSPITPLRAVGTAYVEFFRNIPLLVQMFLWFFVVPSARPYGRASTPCRSVSPRRRERWG